MGGQLKTLFLSCSWSNAPRTVSPGKEQKSSYCRKMFHCGFESATSGIHKDLPRAVMLVVAGDNFIDERCFV